MLFVAYYVLNTQQRMDKRKKGVRKSYQQRREIYEKENKKRAGSSWDLFGKTRLSVTLDNGTIARIRRFQDQFALPTKSFSAALETVCDQWLENRPSRILENLEEAELKVKRFKTQLEQQKRRQKLRKGVKKNV